MLLGGFGEILETVFEGTVLGLAAYGYITKILHSMCATLPRVSQQLSLFQGILWRI
jgi:hypothetical protein